MTKSKTIQRRYKTAAFVILAACLFCLSMLLMSPPQTAAAAEASTEYILALETYSIAGYTQDVVVTSPNQKPVTVTNGSFFVAVAGDYKIEYPNGDIITLSSYAHVPQSEFIFKDSLADKYNAGEIIKIPQASIKSEIGIFNNYSVVIEADGVILQTIATKIPETGYAYMLPYAGEYSVVYCYEDVFGYASSANFEFKAEDKKVIVLKTELPQKVSFGDSITVSAYGYYLMQSYAVKITIDCPTLPDVVLQSAKFNPTEAGVHNITIESDIDGEKIVNNYSVTVECTPESLFSMGTGINSKTANVDLPVYSALTGKATLIRANSSGSSIFYSKVIDLNDFTKDDTLIQFDMYSDLQSTSSAVQITLIDVFNSANTLSVYWWQNPWNGGMSYMLVNCNGLSLGCDNEGGTNLPRGENGFGTNVKNTFIGIDNRNSIPFNFSYDQSEKAVYTYPFSLSSGQYKVLDLDDAAVIPKTNIWGGFTSSLVMMKIEFITNSNAGMYITKLANEDMQAASIDKPVDSNLLAIKSDYSVLHDGAVGYGYTLPYALPNNAANGVVSQQRTLSFGGNDITPQISGNTFVPSQSGDYILKFSAQDRYYNTITKEYPFRVNAAPNPISFNMDTNQSVVITQNYEIPSYSALGGSGKISTNATLKQGGTILTPDINNRFKIMSDENLVLTLHAVDAIGFTATQEITVNILKNIVFTEVNGIPDAVRAGETVVFPALTAFDYNTNQSLPTQLSVNGTVLSTVPFSYTVPENATNLSLVYTAAAGTPNQRIHTAEVAVIPQNISGLADFILPNQTLTDTLYLDNGIMFRLTKNDSSNLVLKMPNALPAENLTFGFSLNANALGFQKTRVTLTDYYNSAQTVFFDIYDLNTASGMAKLKINGLGAEYNVAFETNTYTSAVGMGSESLNYLGKKYYSFSFIFKNNDCRLQTALGKTISQVNKLGNGDNFAGFSSGLARLSFSLVNVTSKSEFVLSKVGNQLFNYYINNTQNKDKDNIGALINYSRPIADSSVAFGSTFVVPAAFAYDVLQSSSGIKLTVTAADNTKVCDGIPISTDFSFEINKYGSYTVRYDTFDALSKTSYATYKINVIDDAAPVLTINGNYAQEYSAGQAVNILSASATDGVDGNIEPTILMLSPDMKYVQLKAGDTYTFNTKGTYTLIYRAADLSYNVARQEIKITVR